MTPSRLRAIADKVEKLCTEGSAFKRTVACPLCRAMAAELRDHAEEIAYGRRNAPANGCEAVKGLIGEDLQDLEQHRQ